MNTVRELLRLIVWLYLMVVFGRLILDWIRVFARDWRPRGVMLVIAEAVYTLTDPPLRALRKVLPRGSRPGAGRRRRARRRRLARPLRRDQQARGAQLRARGPSA